MKNPQLQLQTLLPPLPHSHQKNNVKEEFLCPYLKVLKWDNEQTWPYGYVEIIIN